MSIRFKRISSTIVAILLILIGFSMVHRGHNEQHLYKVRNISRQLVHKTDYEKKHAHRPILTKKIPSSYKLMMSDGKQVSKAVQTIMKQTNGGRRKPNKNNNEYRNAINALNEHVSKKNINWHTHSAWSPFANDSVEVMPGEADSDGDFDCAFLIYTPGKNKRIDGIFLSQYSAATREFVNVDNYGTRQFTNKNVNKKMKKQLKLALVKHNHKRPQKRSHKGGVPHVR